MLACGSSGEIDVSEAEVSEALMVDRLRDSAWPMERDDMRCGGGPGAKVLPRASRCCATDLWQLKTDRSIRKTVSSRQNTM